MSPQPDLELLRRAADRRLTRCENQIEAAILSALADTLSEARFLILQEASTLAGVTAAGFFQPGRAADAVTAAWNTWRRKVTDVVLPAVSIAFGEGFLQVRRTTPGSSYQPQLDYLAAVEDRLVIWPQNAFEELRPELLEALAEAETIEQITDRVGRVLGIDVDTRAIKAEINEVDALLADPELDPEREAILRARRRRLWAAHDAEESQWRWKARRIARTEAHGAVNAGQLQAARDLAADTGEEVHKRWLATDDVRTRASHRVADGQIVPLNENFTVGGAPLPFPGFFGGPAHEVINCRCSLIMLYGDTLQEALQGPDGSLGEVTPGGNRLGPDDPEMAREASSRIIDSPPADRVDPLDEMEAVLDWLDAEDEWKNGLTAGSLSRRGLNRGMDPLNIGRFSRWGDGVPRPRALMPRRDRTDGGGGRARRAIDDPNLPDDWKTPATREHILHGDGRKGGHLSGTGKPGKTEFPPNWTPDTAMDAVATARLRPMWTSTGGDRTNYARIVDDVLVVAVSFVDEDTGVETVVTGYPASGNGVVKNNLDGTTEIKPLQLPGPSYTRHHDND